MGYLPPASVAPVAEPLAVKLATVTTADDLIVGTGNAAVTRLPVAASRIVGKKASGGVAGLTAAELYAIVQSELDTHYAPTRVFVQPNLFRASAGSASQSVERVGAAIGGIPAWVLDAASNESIAGSIFVPFPWATVDIDLWWGNTTTSSGNVRWQGYALGGLTDGSTITGVAQTEIEAAAPGTVGIVKVSSLATGIAVSQNTIFQIGLLRNAAHANDTLPNDAAVYGIVLKKAS